jgi:hypothetical protein
MQGHFDQTAATWRHGAIEELDFDTACRGAS